MCLPKIKKLLYLILIIWGTTITLCGIGAFCIWITSNTDMQISTVGMVTMFGSLILTTVGPLLTLVTYTHFKEKL